MTNCEKLQKISDAIEQQLKSFCLEVSGLEFKLIKQSGLQLFNACSNEKAIQPCFECSSCYDFVFYRDLLFETISNNGDKKILKQELHNWEKVKSNDLIIDHFPIKSNVFNFEKTSIQEKTIFYLDFNIFDTLEKKNLIKDFKNNGNLFFAYSPIHLEETYKIRSEENITKRILTISELTDNLIVLNINNNLSIYKEEPIFSYQRVLNNTELSSSIENQRVIKQEDRDIFFNDLFDSNFRRSINNSIDVFNKISKSDFSQLLLFVGCHYSIEKLKNDVKTYNEILHSIYSLYDLFDNISYYREKEKKDNKTFKSSVYDIEHLIYSTCCDFFVTSDKRLAMRANQIFRFINVKTKIILLKEEEINFSTFNDYL